MEIGVFLGHGVATREALVPSEVLAERLGAEVRWIGLREGPVVGHDPVTLFHAEVAYPVARPDVLVLPGSFGSVALAGDPLVVDWVRATATTGLGVLAVSTGSLLLAATGLLSGSTVAGHWLTGREVAARGALLTAEPIEVHRRLVTVSGVGSSRFGAEFLADLIEYGPVPTG